MDGAEQEEWPANRGPEVPLIYLKGLGAPVQSGGPLSVASNQPGCLMYYLCADLSDVRVNTRPRCLL